MSEGSAWDEFRCEREDIFDKLSDANWFHDFLTFQSLTMFQAFGYLPALNQSGIWDIHERWKDDIERISANDFERGDLDHFKQGGHLCFWVRRTRAVIECYPTTEEAEELSPIVTDVLLMYPNEYLGWDIGFKICRYFEAKRKRRRISLQFYIPSVKYIHNMCHFLSTKATSPHGVAMMYRSLFEGFAGGERDNQP